jgi:hypothetical protein
VREVGGERSEVRGRREGERGGAGAARAHLARDVVGDGKGV